MKKSMKKSYIILESLPGEGYSTPDFSDTLCAANLASFEEAEEFVRTHCRKGVRYICELKAVACVEAIEKIEHNVNIFPEEEGV